MEEYVLTRALKWTDWTGQWLMQSHDQMEHEYLVISSKDAALSVKWIEMTQSDYK